MKTARLELFLQHWANKNLDVRDLHWDSQPDTPAQDAANKLSEVERRRLETLERFYRNFFDLVPRHGGEFETTRRLELRDIFLWVHGYRPPQWNAVWFLCE